MLESQERGYLRHRAEQELAMTFHAECVEAECAHNELTGRYLIACVECADGESEECRDCPLQGICDVWKEKRRIPYALLQE